MAPLASTTTNMSPSKPPYDPMKTVEGMFMGSVTRIAYAMKDPLNFAQSTKAVLAETAKKFQDALDDCEIQILDAKWYLERQLALNRARREAKAREDSVASAKRKRDEGQDAKDAAQNVEGKNASKRVKTEEPEGPAHTEARPQQSSPSQKPAPKPVVTTIKPPTQMQQTATEKPRATKAPAKRKVSTTLTDAKPSQPPAPLAPPNPTPQEKPPEPAQPLERTMAQTTTDDFPKPTPQDTPAESEAFNFESMFGEPSADMDGAGADTGFEFDSLGGDGFGGDSSLQDNSLNSLLPGLESYANQAGDDGSFNLSGTTLNGVSDTQMGGGTNGDSTMMNTQSQQQQSGMNVDSFGLPQLGPNAFDDFLNSNEINFDETVNLDTRDMLNMDDMDNMDNMNNMDNLDNMDFDSMFS